LLSKDYRARAVGWTQEIARVLKPGGRIWVNVPQSLPELGRPQPDRWSPATMWHELLLATGLLLRDWIVWRQVEADAATAWGSHLSPNAPNIRGRYELVVLFFKERWSRGRTEKNDIDSRVWGPWTQNVWDIACVTTRNGHPAPFPAELSRRAILLSTWPGDVVLDPFCSADFLLTSGWRPLGCRTLPVEALVMNGRIHDVILNAEQTHMIHDIVAESSF
jgi:DNA modification methylase